MYGENSGELYARFVQFGVFSPINRLHDCSRPFHTKEPIVYTNGGGLIAEEYLRLRHRLIPYLYSASYDTTREGRALIEPMYYAYPSEKEAYKCKNQYFFGTELLVAPVTTPVKKGGLALTKVWLPKGHWTDIFTGDEYTGGEVITMARWMDSLPVLLKEGGILVLDGRHHTNDVSNPDRLDILVANGNGCYTLHEDDGAGHVADTRFISECRDNHETLTIVSDASSLIPVRAYRVEFRNLRRGEISVTLDGNSHPFTWDDDGALFVFADGVKPGTTLTIDIAYPTRDMREFAMERLLYTMQRIAHDNTQKYDFYVNITGFPDKEGVRTWEAARDFIASSEFTPDVKTRLYESLPYFPADE